MHSRSNWALLREVEVMGELEDEDWWRALKGGYWVCIKTTDNYVWRNISLEQYAKVKALVECKTGSYKRVLCLENYTGVKF